MPFPFQPPAYVEQASPQKKPDIQQKSSGENSPNVVTGNNSTVIINAPPPAQLLKSISELSLKAVIVVRIGDISDEPMVVAKSTEITGFLVSEGYAATCGTILQPKPSGLVAGFLIPPLPGDMVEIGGGVVSRPVASAELSGGIAILNIAGLDIHSRASALDSERGKLNATEEHLVPSLSSVLPDVGDSVFMVGVEPGLSPRFSTSEGSIVSVGPGPQGGVFIFAKLSFKPSYCGAPIFNNRKEVVGLVVGNAPDAHEEVIAIPALYIRRMVKKIGHPSTQQ